MTNQTQTQTEATHKQTPSGIKTVFAYVAGLMLGGLLILPASDGSLVSILTTAQMDATGRSLLFGLLMLFVVSMGLFTLFQIFVFLDR